jgi:hypothetical protein
LRLRPDPPELAHERAALLERPRHAVANDDVRRYVRRRADDRCEHCLIPTNTMFHVDHVVPPSRWARDSAGAIAGLPWIPNRGGPHHVDNDVWSCPFCNNTTSDKLPVKRRGRWVRLFDPRVDDWRAHFRLTQGGLFIEGAGDVGRLTEDALGFNETRRDLARVGERHLLIKAGRYPPPGFGVTS